nr:MAG TPA: hypothetical protein [Caudoviricetes sp.]
MLSLCEWYIVANRPVIKISFKKMAGYSSFICKHFVQGSFQKLRI